MTVTFKIVKFHSNKTNKDYPCLVADSVGENSHGDLISRRTIITFDCKVLSRITSLRYSDLMALGEDDVFVFSSGVDGADRLTAVPYSSGSFDDLPLPF